MLTHIEFTFYLATCNLSTRTRSIRNPFTGIQNSFPIDDGLNDRECQAIRGVLREAGFAKSEIPGEGYELPLSNDGTIRFRGEIVVGEPSFAVEIVIRSLTDYVLELVLSIARAGNFALTSSTGEDVRLLDTPTTTIVEARWPNAPIVRTSDDLRIWLEKIIRGRRVKVRSA